MWTEIKNNAYTSVLYHKPSDFDRIFSISYRRNIYVDRN
nr:MAG TPA: hypothetical protein [Caudoviricetes sp.]